MRYSKTITLKDGRECTLRNGEESDGKAALQNFIEMHRQTDFLLSYPSELFLTAEEEGDYLHKKAVSKRSVEILALVGGELVGTAGIEPQGNKFKVRHRCDFGVSVDKAYWGLGIGRALMEACIECAKDAGFRQMELEVVAENERAVEMYRRAGFVKYGRNPMGFGTLYSGYQELIYMRLELGREQYTV